MLQLVSPIMVWYFLLIISSTTNFQVSHLGANDIESPPTHLQTVSRFLPTILLEILSLHLQREEDSIARNQTATIQGNHRSQLRKTPGSPAGDDGSFNAGTKRQLS